MMTTQVSWRMGKQLPYLIYFFPEVPHVRDPPPLPPAYCGGYTAVG